MAADFAWFGGQNRTKRKSETHRPVGLSSGRMQCLPIMYVLPWPHCITPCPPSFQPCRVLLLGIDTPNRAQRTPQILGSQTEQNLGVANSNRNLRALEIPQATFMMGGGEVEYQYPGTPNGQANANRPIRWPSSLGHAGDRPCASMSGNVVDGAVHHCTYGEERGVGWVGMVRAE